MKDVRCDHKFDKKNYSFNKRPASNERRASKAKFEVDATALNQKIRVHLLQQLLIY